MLRAAASGSACSGRRNAISAFKPASGRRQLVCKAAQQGHSQEPDFMQRCALGLIAAATAAMPLSVSPLLPVEPAHALLTAGDPIKNAQAILRYALPINNKPIRQIQRDLEAISEAVRVPGKQSLNQIAKAVRGATSVLGSQRAAILADVASDKKGEAEASLDKLAGVLKELDALVEAKDKQLVPIKQREALAYVGAVQEAMVKGFPFEVPAEYANRPLLKGRATLEAKVHCRETPEGPQDVKLVIVLDGYNAPVSAGQFMDLVERGFYDGMEIQRADGFVVQTGDPDGPGPADGWTDPATGEVRRVPMEIKVVGDKAPVYDLNLEDLGRFNEQPVLPFNAYGTLAWARSEFDNNSASSQVFFLLKESELTPSGANLLDGRYAVFGYAVEGQDSLGLMKVGDKIEYIKVVSGAENLVNGGK